MTLHADRDLGPLRESHTVGAVKFHGCKTSAARTASLHIGVTVNPAGPDGPVVAGGPVGQCETPSPSSCGVLESLEHSVLIQPGQHAAVGTLSPSDCHPAGPAGPYVAGGPVGPDVSFKILEPLEHSLLDHADPAGQHAAVGMLSPSDCYPAGPAGPCVAGGPVGPDDYLQVLEPLEHSVLDHADPAGQHADVQDTVKSLRAFGSSNYPGWSTYGGDNVPGAVTVYA